MRTLLLIFTCKRPKYADTGEEVKINGQNLRTSFMDGPLVIYREDGRGDHILESWETGVLHFNFATSSKSILHFAPRLWRVLHVLSFFLRRARRPRALRARAKGTRFACQAAAVQMKLSNEGTVGVQAEREKTVYPSTYHTPHHLLRGSYQIYYTSSFHFR